MSDTHGISCREAVERLWSYIDGELPDAEAHSVEAHLGACRGCDQQRGYQSAFRAFLKHHADKPVPPSLRRRVFEALLSEDRRDVPGAPGT